MRPETTPEEESLEGLGMRSSEFCLLIIKSGIDMLQYPWSVTVVNLCKP